MAILQSDRIAYVIMSVTLFVQFTQFWDGVDYHMFITKIALPPISISHTSTPLSAGGK